MSHDEVTYREALAAVRADQEILARREETRRRQIQREGNWAKWAVLGIVAATGAAIALNPISESNAVTYKPLAAPLVSGSQVQSAVEAAVGLEISHWSGKWGTTSPVCKGDGVGNQTFYCHFVVSGSYAGHHHRKSYALNVGRTYGRYENGRFLHGQYEPNVIYEDFSGYLTFAYGRHWTVDNVSS